MIFFASSLALFILALDRVKDDRTEPDDIMEGMTRHFITIIEYRLLLL